MSLVHRRSSHQSPEAARGTLVDRVAGLRQFVAATDGYLPDEMLAPARGVVNRAGERLAVAGEHTVAALAGATGSGKSSIFNRLAGGDLSPVGVRRPTTGTTTACVWGSGEAGPLLDWLGVATRFHIGDSGTAPGIAGPTTADGASLNGLVLLDLPDFDSVDTSHRIEADRLLAVVDVVVWVLDPQKYADRVVHRQYLTRFQRHRDITVVVLNQADRLEPADREHCLDDLRRLLAADGLPGVTALATSATTAGGLDPLRRVLAETVAARRAAVARLSADVAGVVAALEPLVAADVPAAVPAPVSATLTDALCEAAGVPVVGSAVERAYRHRARASVGWPPARWLRRLRPDPLLRLSLGGSQGPRLGSRSGPGLPEEPAGATSVGPAAPAAQARVGLALRAVADRAGHALAGPWPPAVLAAARSHLDDLTDALDVAVARTDLGMDRRPLWWRALGTVQWLLIGAAGVGLVWLGVRYVMFALALPEPEPPHLGRIPVPTVLLLGGLLAGLLVSALTRPVVRIAARRRRRNAVARLRAAVGAVGRDLVLTPVDSVLRAYADARASLTAARD